MSALLVLVKTGMVFGLLALVLFVLKKTDGLGGRQRGRSLEVRGSTRLGKGATLTAVRVDGKDLLLGVTEHSVTLLTSEDAAVDVDEPVHRPVRRPALPFARPSSNL
ncbi:MAG TPA: flagellar biosynthetic protein FliO, partial [Mycobacteriales bacterium]|nr:flagellar biosynthetic protein FliO [Mycobacteriales bacterium]